MGSIAELCLPALEHTLKNKFNCQAIFHGLNPGTKPHPNQFRNPALAPEMRFSVQLTNGLQLSVWRDDLTTHKVDAVVNAANRDLAHYGGLAQALCDAGGREIQQESERYIRSKGQLNTGDAVVTASGRLPCQMIIHAVGPYVRCNPTPSEVDQAKPLLKKAVENVMRIAREKKLKSVAIPALSSGLFNFPLPACADIMVSTIAEHDMSYRRPLDVRLVNHDEPSVREMARACQKMQQAPQASYSQVVHPGKSDMGALTKINKVTLTIKKDLIQNAKILRGIILKCLDMAKTNKVPSISFPAIGTGALGFSKKEVAQIMVEAAVQFAMHNPNTKMDIHFVIHPKEYDTVKPARDRREREAEMEPGQALIELISAFEETSREAKRWIHTALGPPPPSIKNTTIQNNFIQHFGQGEFEELECLQQKWGVSMSESFDDGLASIVILGTSGNAKAAGIEVECMCCRVQEEFAREEESTMAAISTSNSPTDKNGATTVAYRTPDFKEGYDDFTGLKIVRVDKVENPILKELFELRKKQLNITSSPRRMYQFLPAQFCNMVHRVGFQREYTPPYSQNCGDGIYFAGSVREARKLWCNLADQEEYLYLVEAQVLEGHSTIGSPGLIVPPCRGLDPLVLYDSLHGRPDTVVIFNRHQALPDYIITCQSSWKSQTMI
ncbi:protein mono-ADP-ribosyltransferase PARP9 [Aplochiton taeniatus]